MSNRWWTALRFVPEALLAAVAIFLLAAAMVAADRAFFSPGEWWGCLAGVVAPLFLFVALRPMLGLRSVTGREAWALWLGSVVLGVMVAAILCAIGWPMTRSLFANLALAPWLSAAFWGLGIALDARSGGRPGAEGGTRN